jgi:hypothetical protein
VGRVTLLMVMGLVFCHQGQGLPTVPGGMLAPKVIRSPLATPLPATLADIVTVE